MKPYLSFILLVFLVVSCSKDEKTVTFELSTSISPTEGGSVSSSNGTFDSGEEIQLIAIPADGYVFLNWSGAINSTENPLSITFNADKNITAVFEKSDGDKDGVPDDEDQCSETYSGEAVDAQGCSESQKDTDGDGVNDSLDQCPDTTSGDEVDAAGCPSDTTGGGGEIEEDADGDGIEDDSDECPGTPEGETADNQGCSESQKDAILDTDGDGVNDDSDECAATPEGQEVNAQGCSKSQRDSDGDGVNDESDECNETPKGEEVDEKGCSDSQIDGDGDGVSRDEDQCPGTPVGEGADANGCSDSQKDTDGDGVNDAIDQCPETPDGDVVEETGCAISLTTFVPDDRFESLLIEAGYDDVLDDFVLTAEIADVTELTLLGGDFDPAEMDLTGLEDFISLEELSIGYVNNLILDLSRYPSLKSLSMYEVSMNSLVIGPESNLGELRFEELVRIENFAIVNNDSLVRMIFQSDNFVTSLTITGNSRLEIIGDFDGRFGNVIIADNPALRTIDFGETDEVLELELGRNEALETFSLNLIQDEVYPLDFSTSPNLKRIDLGFRGGDYGSINISQNLLLESLFAEGCGLTSLDVSNNPLLTDLSIERNLLTCIKVNETQFSDIPTNWSKDDLADYALECPE